MSCLHDHGGKVSMMRVGFFVTLVTGCMMCLSGIVAVFIGKAGFDVMITAGVGLMTSSGWAKAVQTKWESRNVRTDTDKGSARQ